MTENYTQAWVGQALMEGTNCTACGRTYERCTRRVIGSHGAACCASCKNTQTHAERPTRSEVTATFDIPWAKVEAGDVVVRRMPHDGGPLKVVIKRKVDPFRAALAEAISGKENGATINLVSVNPLMSAEAVVDLLKERGIL